MMLTLVGTEPGRGQKDPTRQWSHWEGCEDRLAGGLQAVLRVGPWTKDEACGEHEIDANAFLTPSGTLKFGGQPHCARPPARL